MEERVIGAGLQVLDKDTDGAAIKDLFHMLAVTQVSTRAKPPARLFSLMPCI